MELETKRKLDAVLACESDRRKAVAEAQGAGEAKKRVREAQEKGARDQLPAFRKRLSKAVEELNEHLSGRGIAFSIAEGRVADVALAQIYVQLTGDEAPAKECQVVLNISALGLVQPVFLIPHSGKATPNDNIATMTSEAFAEMMVEFLDQVIAQADKKSGRRNFALA